MNFFLDQVYVLVDEQFGFKENSSTDIATYALLNTVLLSLEKKKNLVVFSVIYKKLLIV